MHIWDEKPLSIMHHKSSAALKMDYSHCPLKKRPVNYVEHEENMDFDNTEESSEPENLSTKPQDLSVKCKSVITAVPLEPKKEILSPNNQQPPHHYQVVAPYSLQSPYHPYQPTAIKPGPLPLAPLCLNIAGDHHSASMAPASAYHKQYTPATPRPVPAQYPSTGYLAGYMYQPHHDRGYSAVASAGYPQSMVMSAGRDTSLSPSGSAGSAFKPLHTSPGSVATTSSLSPPALLPWYGRHGGWSPSGTDVRNASPPLHQRRLPPPYAVPLPMPSSCSSTSSTGVSPPYAQMHCPLPPPPPAVPYQPMHCSVVVSTGAAAAIDNGESRRPPPSSQPSGSPTVSAAVAGGARRKAAAVAAGRFKCPSCTKTYSTASGLTKHQQHHCADDRCLIVAKTFCCKYCDKAYNTLGALKMHIRTHTLPCICKLCGKAFSRPWLLQGHIRTHTGEKPFSCQHCNRAFADRSNLRAHLQTHSDVKKYSCLSCSKTFSRMSLLSKHCDSGCLTARMPPMPPIPQQQQPQQPQQQQQQPITI